MTFPDSRLARAVDRAVCIQAALFEDCICVPPVPVLEPQSKPGPLPPLPSALVLALFQASTGRLWAEAVFMVLGARPVWVQILRALLHCVALGRCPNLSGLIQVSHLLEESLARNQQPLLC